MIHKLYTSDIIIWMDYRNIMELTQNKNSNDCMSKLGVFQGQQ